MENPLAHPSAMDEHEATCTGEFIPPSLPGEDKALELTAEGRRKGAMLRMNLTGGHFICDGSAALHGVDPLGLYIAVGKERLCLPCAGHWKLVKLPAGAR